MVPGVLDTSYFPLLISYSLLWHMLYVEMDSWSHCSISEKLINILYVIRNLISDLDPCFTTIETSSWQLSGDAAESEMASAPLTCPGTSPSPSAGAGEGLTSDTPARLGSCPIVEVGSLSVVRATSPVQDILDIISEAGSVSGPS